MKNYTSYEKEVIARVEKIKHTVRIRINERAVHIIESLRQVPSDAVVTAIVDDSGFGVDGFGEIIFEEQRKI